jgi:hypothetical protein
MRDAKLIFSGAMFWSTVNAWQKESTLVVVRCGRSDPTLPQVNLAVIAMYISEFKHTSNRP